MLAFERECVFHGTMKSHFHLNPFDKVIIIFLTKLLKVNNPFHLHGGLFELNSFLQKLWIESLMEDFRHLESVASISNNIVLSQSNQPSAKKVFDIITMKDDNLQPHMVVSRHSILLTTLYC